MFKEIKDLHKSYPMFLDWKKLIFLRGQYSQNRTTDSVQSLLKSQLTSLQLLIC